MSPTMQHQSLSDCCEKKSANENQKLSLRETETQLLIFMSQTESEISWANSSYSLDLTHLHWN